MIMNGKTALPFGVRRRFCRALALYLMKGGLCPDLGIVL